MAPKAKTTPATEVPPAENKQLETVTHGKLVVPSFVPMERTGYEHIERKDVQIPRLGIAQQMSPQLVDTDPQFVRGLMVKDLFNKLTGEIYGQGPLEFAIIRADAPRGVEFQPRKEGGGIKDFDVPLDDERMQFTTDEKGERQKPKATLFYDYVFVLLDDLMPISMSFKSTGLKTAKKLNWLISSAPVPLFARRYIMSTVMTPGQKGTYVSLNVAYAPANDEKGQLEGFVDQELFTKLQSMYNSFKDKEIVYEREPGDDVDDEPSAAGTMASDRPDDTTRM